MGGRRGPRPEANPKPIFNGLVIAYTSFTGNDWNEANVSRWVTFRKGRLSAEFDASVTHLVCSEEDVKKKHPKVREAQRRGVRNCKLVTQDWLEDSMHAHRRLPEEQFSPLKAILKAKKEAARLKQVLKGIEQGEKTVNTNLYHHYQDHTFFAYVVKLERADDGERYVLFLEESNAKPHLYWFFAKYYKSKGNTFARVYRPSTSPGPFQREFDHFRNFFQIKTNITWEERLVKEGTTDKKYFQYKSPRSEEAELPSEAEFDLTFSEGEVIVAEPKRKRGRPRKAQLTEDNSSPPKDRGQASRMGPAGTREAGSSAPARANPGAAPKGKRAANTGAARARGRGVGGKPALATKAVPAVGCGNGNGNGGGRIPPVGRPRVPRDEPYPHHQARVPKPRGQVAKTHPRPVETSAPAPTPVPQIPTYTANAQEDPGLLGAIRTFEPLLMYYARNSGALPATIHPLLHQQQEQQLQRERLYRDIITGRKTDNEPSPAQPQQTQPQPQPWTWAELGPALRIGSQLRCHGCGPEYAYGCAHNCSRHNEKRPDLNHRPHFGGLGGGVVTPERQGGGASLGEDCQFEEGHGHGKGNELAAPGFLSEAIATGERTSLSPARSDRPDWDGIRFKFDKWIPGVTTGVEGDVSVPEDSLEKIIRDKKDKKKESKKETKKERKSKKDGSSPAGVTTPKPKSKTKTGKQKAGREKKILEEARKMSRPKLGI